MTKTQGSHVSIIPFPVCEYAVIHYKDGRRLEKLYTRKMTNNKIKLIKIYVVRVSLFGQKSLYCIMLVSAECSIFAKFTMQTRKLSTVTRQRTAQRTAVMQPSNCSELHRTKYVSAISTSVRPKIRFRLRFRRVSAKNKSFGKISFSSEKWPNFR